MKKNQRRYKHMERNTMLLDWKNQYGQYYLRQSTDSMKSYQITNYILYRIITKYFKICKETQKTSNSQSNIEKKKKRKKRAELEESGSLISGSNTKLQSSKEYCTGTKTEI